MLHNGEYYSFKKKNSICTGFSWKEPLLCLTYTFSLFMSVFCWFFFYFFLFLFFAFGSLLMIVYFCWVLVTLWCMDSVVLEGVMC